MIFLRGDEKHVEGEVKVARAFSSLQTSASGGSAVSEDSEFSAAEVAGPRRK